MGRFFVYVSLACLACASNAQRNPESRALAKLLQTANPTAAFSPFGISARPFGKQSVKKSQIPLCSHIAVLSGKDAATICNMFDTRPQEGGYLEKAARSSYRSQAAVMEAVSSNPTGGDLYRETSRRSLVKEVGWRIIASIITIVLGYIFTNSWATAAKVLGWDLVIKPIPRFIAERVWNRFDWGKEKGRESNKRSILKVFIWRSFALTNTFIGSFVMTQGATGASSKIAIFDTLIKTFCDYAYQRLWSLIEWGKVYPEVEAPASA